MTAQQFLGCSLVLLVAGTLAAAGVAKGRNRTITTRSFAELGLPRPALLAALVPVVEIAVAALMVLRFSIGALVATALLVVFTAFLAQQLRSGRRISCGCFGSSSSTPVTSLTIFRNLGLIVAALAGAFATKGLSRTDFALSEWLAAVSVAASMGLIGALIIGLSTIKTNIGSVFSPSLVPAAPSRTSASPTQGPTQ
jgi:hypothetical protein